MSLLLAAAIVVLGADNPADSIVVCPDSFRHALQPWIEYRESQGHQFAFVASNQTPEEIRNDIQTLAASGKVRSIVLVGDANPQAPLGSSLRSKSTPTFHPPATVNVLWGSEPTLASDNPYADFDGDMLPDVSIGRLSADSPQQLAMIVNKIITYETKRTPGLWKRRINFVAGVGGFGALADNVIETATKKVLTDGIPAAYETSMTYGSWRSPFCPDPRHFHEATVDRLNEGSLFWVYIGHGQRRYLDQVRTPTGLHHIFDTDDVTKIRRSGGAPIAVFLACYAGAFDEVRDCLGEELLRAEQGPVASLCGSRITMPYAMSVMGHELMNQYFVERRELLGELVLHAKRQMVRQLSDKERSADTTRHLLDSIAAVISPAPESLAEERLEHLLMFNLLGDPLLRIDQPSKIDVVVHAEAAAGGKLRVVGNSEIAGRCTVELVCRRDRLKTRFIARPRYDGSDEALAEYMNVYAQANDRTWATNTFTCEGGSIETTLDIPRDAQGSAHVRILVDGDKRFALGATKLYITRSTPSRQQLE